MLRKALLAAGVALVVLAALVALVARGTIGNETMRRTLEAQLSASLHQPVTIGRLGASFFPRVALDLHDVTIGQPSGATIAELSIVTGLRGLLSKRVEDAEVIVSNSRIPLKVALAIVGAAASAPPSAPGAGLTIVSVRTLSFRHVEVVSSPYTLLIDLESALAGDRLDVSRLAAQSADTRIEMRGAISSLTRRLGKFTATASRLNLDELLAVASAMTSQAGGVAANGTATPAAAASPMDITIELTAPGGLLRGYTLQDLSASLRITPEELLLQPLKFGLFGGTYEGRLAVMTQGAAPEAKLTGQLSGMGVERILRETRGSASLSGTLSGSVALTTHGDSSESMLAAARGNGRVTISNGVVPGLEMVRAVVLAFGKPTGVPPAGSGSAFTRIDGTFTLADRTLRSQDLSFNSRDFDMTGTPVVRLTDGAIDMHATVMLSRELTAQAGTDLRRYTVQDGRIVLPARITGTVAAPSVTIDMAAALQRALQNEIRRRMQGLFDKIIK